uniref:Gustatory receptor for sugar taste 64e-like n=1 Tax=Diabrotica virgifera virgifera TaxID=50390 RepID=A0A6P7H559_DIAVI
ERKGFVDLAYFVFSFAFLVSRIIAVSMFGAWLYEEAKKPMEILYNVPTEFYCIEIGRLIEQIYTSPIGITGLRFFMVTRNFMLQVCVK